MSNQFQPLSLFPSRAQSPPPPQPEDQVRLRGQRADDRVPRGQRHPRHPRQLRPLLPLHLQRVRARQLQHQLPRAQEHEDRQKQVRERGGGMVVVIKGGRWEPERTPTYSYSAAAVKHINKEMLLIGFFLAAAIRSRGASWRSAPPSSATPAPERTSTSR